MDLSREIWQRCALTKPSAPGPIPPVRGKCPEGTKGVGTGGPKGRMRVGEHHRYCCADIRCLQTLISHGLRRASFPQGKPIWPVRIRTILLILMAVSIDCTYSKAAANKSDAILTGGAYHSARIVTECEYRSYQISFLPELHRRMHPASPTHSFLPYLFSCERKDRASGGTSETALPERAAAVCGGSFPIRPFLHFQPAGQACGLVFHFSASVYRFGRMTARKRVTASVWLRMECVWPSAQNSASPTWSSRAAPSSVTVAAPSRMI